MDAKTPFQIEGNWYKGNLHCHSTDSDGELPAEQVIDFYKTRDYHFIALTDHHFFTDHSHKNGKDFVVIPAVERSVEQKRMPKSEHLNGFQMKPANGESANSRTLKHGQAIPPKFWLTQHDVQEAINELREQGMAVTLNHPGWSRSDRETLLKAQDYFAIEIYNHVAEYEERNGLATDYWDFLLRRGRKVWGVAVDDTHYYNENRAIGGWVVVKAPQLTQESIVESLLNGHFYSSSGPAILDFKIEQGEAFVKCSSVDAIHFITYERRGKSIRANGNGPLTSARWKLCGDELYIRVECQDALGRSAWTNPVYYNQDFLKYVNENYLS